MIKYRGQ